MKFGAFIMTFNRPQILRNTIEQILAQTYSPEHILVVDNGDAEVTQKILQEFTGQQQTIVYHSMGGNLGPAGAAAYGLERLASEGYEWIYWGDDDDPPRTNDTLERVLRLFTHENSVQVGAVGAVGARFDWRIGEMRRLQKQELNGPTDVDIIAGNQQLIIHRSAVEQVGVVEPQLFFGLEEPEYCLRMRRAGFQLLIDGDWLYEKRAKSGQLDMKSKRQIVSAYPARSLWRRYYSTRNYIYMMRHTFGRPDLARREAFKAMGRTVTAARRGPGYWAEFARLQLLGILDGYRGRMGRTVEPLAKY